MVAHWIKSFFLWEFILAHWLTLKYFFKPKATINYPYEVHLLRAVPGSLPGRCDRRGAEHGFLHRNP